MTAVYISVDMEGVAGVATREHVLPGRAQYEQGRRLMTLEANAAVEGAFEAGATTVLVNDSHGPMDNLLPELLDPRAELVLGSPKRLAMVEQVNTGFDVALFIGYHAGPDSLDGGLAHAFSGAAFSGLWLNGRPLTEFELNALVCSQYGVGVGLVTGDVQTCDAARAELPGVMTVPVKRGLGLLSTRSNSPSLARARIRDGALQAVSGAPSIAAPPDVWLLEARLRPPGAADFAQQVPGSVRRDTSTVARECSHAVEVLDVVQTWSRLTSAFLAG